MESEQAAELPLFPLAQVVLFPRVRAPLYIFEPRYREMVRDSLAGAQRIGMVSVRPEGVAQMAGDPPVFDVGCEGNIVRSVPNADGSFHILLEGTRRFRIRDELPAGHRLYRTARVEHLDDDTSAPCDPVRIRELRVRVLHVLQQLMERSAPDTARSLPEGLFDDVDDDTVANALSQALDFDPLEKQGLLETDGPGARLARLAELLDFRLLERSATQRSEGGVVH